MTTVLVVILAFTVLPYSVFSVPLVTTSGTSSLDEASDSYQLSEPIEDGSSAVRRPVASDNTTPRVSASSAADPSAGLTIREGSTGQYDPSAIDDPITFHRDVFLSRTRRGQMTASNDASRFRELHPAIPWGGRTMAIDVSPESPSGRIALAASDSGGLFKTTDGGNSWRHVDSLPPFRLYDVKYAPSDSDVVIVTALSGSRTMERGGVAVPIGGIWRSTDGGDTWEKPIRATPRNCNPPNNRPNGLGIAFEPGTDRVYVGTECGLSVSENLGESWSHIYVNGSSRYVSSVVVSKERIVDICGNGGHFRLDWADDTHPSNGDWTGGNLPNGCRFPTAKFAPQSIAVSPLDPDTLFVTVEANLSRCQTKKRDGWTRTVFESTDGGQSWTDLGVPCNRIARPPFVTTPPVAPDGTFDLYFGNGVDTLRQSNCNIPFGCDADRRAWDEIERDHADQIDIAYPSGVECPKFMANDGGVERTDDCGDTWYNVGKAMSGYNALQFYQVTGQLIESPPHTDMYIGSQDNGIWASPDGGTTWTREVGPEGGFLSISHRAENHDDIRERKGIVGIRCAPCQRFRSGPHFEDDQPWRGKGTMANGTPQFIEPGVYVEWGAVDGVRRFAELWLTEDNGDSWRKVIRMTIVPSSFGLRIAGPPADPTVYVPVERGSRSRVGLIKITNVRGPGGANVVNADNGLRIAVHPREFQWTRVVAVHPTDPNHLLAADYDNRVVNVSTDGGQTWGQDLELTRYVVNESEYRSTGAFGPGRPGTYDFIWGLRDGICCSQISAVAFDPADRDRILIGTHANGIIASVDGGKTWGRVPGSRRIPTITSFFFDERRGEIYVSSWGRGLWVLDEDRLTPLRQIQGRDRFGPRESRTSIVDPDRFEDNQSVRNDNFSRPTELNRFEEHSHFENVGAAEKLNWIGEDRELWIWRIDNLTLHDGSDVDFFSLDLPDPERNQSDHNGFPECASIAIDPEETPLPARFVDGGNLVIESRLTIIPSATVPLSGAAPPDDVVTTYDARTGRPVERFIKCPRSEHGVTEIVASYGERPKPDRIVFPEYELGMTYRSHIQFIPKPAEWMLDEIEVESGQAAGVFPCGQGIFPHSCDDSATFEFRHPQSLLPEPDCRADGPGCPMFWGFHWQAAHSFDVSFISTTNLQYELLDASGQTIARAQEISPFFGVGPGVLTGSFRTEERSRISESSRSQTSLTTTAKRGNSDEITKRLVVSDLEPGFYVLKVNGTEADVSVRFDPPPSPPIMTATVSRITSMLNRRETSRRR